MNDEKFDEQRGSLKEFGGKIEKATGDILDDKDLRDDGKRVEGEGTVQKEFGKAKNVIGEVIDKVKDAFDPNNKDPLVDKDFESGPRRDSGSY